MKKEVKGLAHVVYLRFLSWNLIPVLAFPEGLGKWQEGQALEKATLLPLLGFWRNLQGHRYSAPSPPPKPQHPVTSYPRNRSQRRETPQSESAHEDWLTTRPVVYK